MQDDERSSALPLLPLTPAEQMKCEAFWDVQRNASNKENRFAVERGRSI